MRGSRRSHARTSKAAAKRSRLPAALAWAAALAGALYLAWLLLFPSLSGLLGRWAAPRLVQALGAAAYLLPLLALNALLWHRRTGRAAGWSVNAGASLLTLLSCASLFALAAQGLGFDSVRGGGAAGAGLAAGLSEAFGTFGALALSLAVLLFCLQFLFGIRWARVAAGAGQLLLEDLRQWQRARRELSAKLAEAQALESAGRREEPPSAPPQNLAPRTAPPVLEQAAPTPPARPKAKAPRPQPAAAPAAQSGAPQAYQPPSLELLSQPAADRDRGRPQEAEILASVAELERTLKSFGVEARVTGYAPGPVITRFELSPAPGVKVSSIVALENDIALALRAKGIRIIAPIPGKAAVGIEIPNAKPATVVLREILESPAIPPGAGPLSFALGLSAAGEPRAADLQKMPHLLIAGATNSGKSVMIHSLILSMLFRTRPDEVKLLLIDPKRLELTFYEGIPHLFDPTSTADKVTVVTNPKDASKSLQALVRLMERRYEEFQLFGVRNIDSYNREADARGKPRAFFIVVVIDELADLMLVAQEQVEDSIQRLTQMARAVGIHLVLATQRPSVDVITGVIKANLPARIALQVISKVDSKVILDTTGADALQGKGDLLYLAAGAQRPERCQGAYVSEEEISRIAAHLRAQGKPDYPMLETMAKAAEADLSAFGVDPLEFSQALKLVLERRRVSQDLLKSQFGSSARATNLLSALEVKELIRKPEGSNRWEIHFDAIEDYLREHYPQVPLDRRS